MSEKELKPCPFCGGEAKIYKTKTTSLTDTLIPCYFVFCKQCCCQTQYSKTENEAISKWNRRTDNGN